MPQIEDLPFFILSDILSRLPNSGDVAAARAASPALRDASYNVSAVVVVCTAARFRRSRAGAVVPFRSVVVNLVSLLAGSLDSISLFAEGSVDAVAEIDENDDHHLTAVDFLDRWLPLVVERLRSLVVSDCWLQSCYRPSEALAFISDRCCNLLHLEVRNAWLLVTGLKPMQNLTSLTLNYIRLDDKNLDMLNECFPSLQVLNLTQVGGLSEPKINLPCLRVFTWILSNYAISLTICAPKLVELKLRCGKPKAFVLEAPLLLKLDLSIIKLSGAMKFGTFVNLQELSMTSLDLCSLVQLLSGNRTVKQLVLKTHVEGFDFDDFDQIGSTSTDLMDSFPCLDELILQQRDWCLFPKLLSLKGERSLNKLTLYLPKDDLDADGIMLKLHPLLMHNSFCQVVMKLPVGACISYADCLISKCSSDFPKIQWKWSTWICEDDGCS